MVLKWLKSALGKRSDTAEEQRFQVGSCAVHIGRFTYGTKRMQVIDWGEGFALSVGSFCSIASGLRVLMGGNHQLEWISTYPFGMKHQDVLTPDLTLPTALSHKGGDVSIGHDVWIGMDVTVLSGVTIGDGAVIAAQAVVTKDIGAYEIWGGNPAKFIRKRFDDDTIAALRALEWWHLPVEKITEMTPLLCGAPSAQTLTKLKELA